MKIERCCDCDEPTGKAGAGDGSLFQGAYGPLCDKCFDEWPDKMTAEVARLKGIIRNHKVAERVPDGWQLVPVEPTPDMIDAVISYANWDDLQLYGVDLLRADIWHNWNAMLAAAPQQKKEGE